MPAVETRGFRRSLNVAIAGGGTGGHLFPGIAVAEAFKMKDPQNEILFVGVGNPFEKAALERAGYPQRTIAIEGIKGRGLWAKARAGLKIPVALFQAAGILSEMQADLVIGVGGYAAGPVAMAAWFKRIPVVICEQNTVPGITNRLLFPVARRIYLSFEATRGRIDPRKNGSAAIRSANRSLRRWMSKAGRKINSRFWWSAAARVPMPSTWLFWRHWRT